MKLIVGNFLPDKETLACLRTIRDDVRVRRIGPVGLGPTTLLFVLRNLPSKLRVFVTWEDVIFKHELLIMKLERHTDDDISDVEDVSNFVGWTTLHCLFRFEWDRDARPAEVPSGHETIVARRGKRRQVPESPYTIGVSMVGIAFRSPESDRYVGAVVNSDDDPTSMDVLSCDPEVDAFCEECDCVEVGQVDRWLEDTSQWLKACSERDMRPDEHVTRLLTQHRTVK